MLLVSKATGAAHPIRPSETVGSDDKKRSRESAASLRSSSGDRVRPSDVGANHRRLGQLGNYIEVEPGLCSSRLQKSRSGMPSSAEHRATMCAICPFGWRPDLTRGRFPSGRLPQLSEAHRARRRQALPNRPERNDVLAGIEQAPAPACGRESRVPASSAASAGSPPTQPVSRLARIAGRVARPGRRPAIALRARSPRGWVCHRVCPGAIAHLWPFRPSGCCSAGKPWRDGKRALDHRAA